MGTSSSAASKPLFGPYLRAIPSKMRATFCFPSGQSGLKGRTVPQGCGARQTDRAVDRWRPYSHETVGGMESKRRGCDEEFIAKGFRLVCMRVEVPNPAGTGRHPAPLAEL